MNTWNKSQANRAFSFNIPKYEKSFKPWEREITPRTAAMAMRSGGCLVEIPSSHTDREFVAATTAIDLAQYAFKHLHKNTLSIRSGVQDSLARQASEAIESVAATHKKNALIIVEGIDTVGPAVVGSLVEVLGDRSCPVVATIFEGSKLPDRIGEFLIDTYRLPERPGVTATQPEDIVFEYDRVAYNR